MKAHDTWRSHSAAPRRATLSTFEPHSCRAGRMPNHRCCDTARRCDVLSGAVHDAQGVGTRSTSGQPFRRDSSREQTADRLVYTQPSRCSRLRPPLSPVPSLQPRSCDCPKRGAQYVVFTRLTNRFPGLIFVRRSADRASTGSQLSRRSSGLSVTRDFSDSTPGRRAGVVRGRQHPGTWAPVDRTSAGRQAIRHPRRDLGSNRRGMRVPGANGADRK